jgi:tetratricopeptide (TPR) repeat protein
MLIAAMCGAFAMATAGAAFAIDTGPARPRVDCTKKANKNKPQCQKGYHDLTDDEIYNAGYVMVHEGRYREALALLGHVRNINDVRVLTIQGFATRKLGDVDGAMPFYTRALALDPGNTRTREYLGEAYLTKGDLANAQNELKEIEVRCGQTCSGYPELAARIAEFKAGRQHAL